MNHEYPKSGMASLLINCITARVSRLLSHCGRRERRARKRKIENKGNPRASNAMRRRAFNERSLLTWPLLIATQSDASRQTGTHALAEVRHSCAIIHVGRCEVHAPLSLPAAGRDIALIQKYRSSPPPCPGTGLYIAHSRRSFFITRD